MSEMDVRSRFYVSRRDFLRYSLSAGVVIWAGSAVPRGMSRAEAQELFEVRAVDPTVFPQGIASGDPKPDGIVLWTRVAGLGAGTTVAYEVATDEAFVNVVLRGTAETSAERDNTVKVQLKGREELSPFTTYYYRFVYGGASSRTGRFKTLPSAGADLQKLRLAYISCQDYTNGFYTALAHLANEEVDYVVHLGDYIYETTGEATFQNGQTRSVALSSGRDRAENLADYRELYKIYKSDENLQRVHERNAFIVIWDDHEFANDCHEDYDTDGATLEENRAPQRREDANRSWAEFLPVGEEGPVGEGVFYDPSQGPLDEISIYRSFVFGNLAELVMTDERLYRDPHPYGPKTEDKYFQPDNKPGEPGPLASLDLTMLGDAQKQWFLDKVTGSTRRWKLWGNETMVMQFKQSNTDIFGPTVPSNNPDGVYVNLDQWDGYQKERREILQAIETAGVENFVILTGDIHSYIAGYAKIDYSQPSNEPGPNVVGTCFVCGSVTSANLVELGTAGQVSSPISTPDPGAFSAATTASNPHVQFFNSDRHGYNIVEITPESFVCTMKEVSTIKEPTATSGILRRFRVPNGVTRIEDVTNGVPAEPEPQPQPTNTRPSITEPRPRPGSRTRDRTPRITARVRDAETDLARSNIRLYVDGRRVTRFSYDRSRNRLSFVPRNRLSPGRHRVKVVARDAQGLAQTRAWGFNVAP